MNNMFVVNVGALLGSWPAFVMVWPTSILRFHILPLTQNHCKKFAVL